MKFTGGKLILVLFGTQTAGFQTPLPFLSHVFLGLTIHALTAPPLLGPMEGAIGNIWVLVGFLSPLLKPGNWCLWLILHVPEACGDVRLAMCCATAFPLATLPPPSGLQQLPREWLGLCDVTDGYVPPMKFVYFRALDLPYIFAPRLCKRVCSSWPPHPSHPRHFRLKKAMFNNMSPEAPSCVQLCMQTCRYMQIQMCRHADHRSFFYNNSSLVFWLSCVFVTMSSPFLYGFIIAEMASWSVQAVALVCISSSRLKKKCAPISSGDRKQQ